MRSTGIGWALGIGRLGAIVGPMMGGILLSLDLPLMQNFIAFAVPGLIAALAIWFVQEKYADMRSTAVAEEQVSPQSKSIDAIAK